jgi:hypothetical protein
MAVTVSRAGSASNRARFTGGEARAPHFLQMVSLLKSRRDQHGLARIELSWCA